MEIVLINYIMRIIQIQFHEGNTNTKATWPLQLPTKGLKRIEIGLTTYKFFYMGNYLSKCRLY